MPVVKHQLDAVGGGAATGSVTISRHPHSFTVDHADVVLPLTVAVPASGLVEVTLLPETDYVTAGYYVLTEPGGHSHTFQVPDEAGPLWLDDLVTELAPAATVLPVLFSALRDTGALAAAADGQVPVWHAATQRWVPGSGSGGASDHGALSGLGDHDHPQYYTEAEADALLATKASTATTDALDVRLDALEAVDPLTQAEGDSRYSLLGHNHTGTYQPADADLTAIAGLTPSNDDVLQRKAGAWTNRTPTQLKTDLALTKSDLGLGNVDNTSDAAKPISTATQTALDGKLGVVLVDAKGDLFAGSAADTVVRLAVGSNGQVLTADSGETTGLRWATPASGAGARLTLADQMGCACVTQDPSLITSAAVGLTSGTLYGCSAILPAGRTLTHVLVGLRQAGATPTGVSKLGVLAADGTRLGLTADSATLWTTGDTTARELALTATIAADADDDRLIYLVMLSTCTDAPQVYLGQLLTNSLFNPRPTVARRSWVLAGQTDIPASVDIGSTTLNSGVFQLYAR